MIAIDSNILVYAQERSDDPRRRRAIGLLDRLSISGAVISLQVLGEFANVCIRKLAVVPIDLIDQIDDYLGIFHCPATEPEDLIGALLRKSTHNLQFFDALILAVAKRAGATVLLSEDMQDGLDVEGVCMLNPFNPVNAAAIEHAMSQ